MVSYMTNEEEMKMMMSAVMEATTKMALIRDYIERFKISDVRILAPIQDIDRCVCVLDHILNHNPAEDFGEGGNY